jgi:hypothetical protein
MEMANKPKGPRGGVKHQPGRGHDRKSAPSKKRKIAKKAARKRKQIEEEARKQWEEWNRIPEEARKLLGPQAMPKLPRPNHDN